SGVGAARLAAAAQLGMPVTRAAVATSGQRSTCASDLRLRSKCQAANAAVIPLASRAIRSGTWRVSLHRPSSSAPSNARVSVAGRAAPAGRQRSPTGPPKAGEKGRWGPWDRPPTASGKGGAAPAGRQRAHTLPPKAGEKARWGPATPHRAQSEKEGA